MAAHYYDKYFAKQGWYARLFAELLCSPWLDGDSLITVHTDQLHDEDDCRRRDTIQEQFKDLPNFRLEWRERYQHQLDHARNLDFAFADHPSWRLRFDKGIDFVRRRMKLMSML